MRFVDMAPLQFPAGWQGRADQALNDLRTEIAQADAAARAGGGDPVAARKAAITAGLNQPGRQQIWRDLGPHLSALSKGKCWYSESLNPTSDKNVDHFRPKGRVEEDPTHEGYWWLAFTSRNFRYSSQWCNQRRVDGVNGTSGGKADHFPLLANGVRARLEADNLELEDPELLDPTDPDDWKLLTFLPDGYPTPAKPTGAPEYQRAAKSIEIYHLHCKQLVNGRFSVAGAIQRIVQDLERLRPKIDDLEMRRVYKDRHVELLRAIHPDSEYSAAARAYARAEIYKLEGGHQVKRDWLEEILN
ncbi:MAG TPA: hypothetical protein VE377_06715 [Candidatus Dormibacteraeota bacterium]|nr:hypothetical protein [Candidatus Dormibacteraeota bacterium]